MYPTIDVLKTGERIHQLMEQNNLTAKDIQCYLSLACVQSVYRWLNGESVPSLDNLYALSVLFHTSMDSIVQGNKEIINEQLNISHSYCPQKVIEFAVQ